MNDGSNYGIVNRKDGKSIYAQRRRRTVGQIKLTSGVNHARIWFERRLNDKSSRSGKEIPRGG